MFVSFFSNHVLDVPEIIKHFTFCFHEVYPYFPCVDINEVHNIFIPSNGFGFHGLHIKMITLNGLLLT